MARRKSRLSRLLDVKPAAFALFRGITAPLPVSRHWLGFYPEIGPVPDRLDRVAEACEYRIKLADPMFRPALEVLDRDNWDVHRPHIQSRDPFISKRFVGVVRDVIVPGHTLTPVDPATWRQIGFDQVGRSNWNFAHLGPSILKSRRIRDTAIVVPPFWNYWHLFLEHLLPLIQAARLRAWGDGRLVVVTRPKRPPLIDATIAGLRADGLDIEVVEAQLGEHLRLDRMLVAVNQCWNVERSYSLADAVPTASRLFEAAYRDRPAKAAGRRLYITRRGSKLRQVQNEEEVIDGLRRRDFAVLRPDWDNHPEQLAAFAGAEIVIGVHGAGLSNIIFTAPGTKVVEIFPTDHRKTAMLHLAAEHGLNHHPHFASKEGFNQAFSVDTDAFLADIDRLL